MAFVELEAFKHAIREETITIADFKIANIKREMIERMVKIEARNKELGDECSEIIPRRIFNVSVFFVLKAVIRNMLAVSMIAKMRLIQ